MKLYYEIIKNDRKGYGFDDDTLKCNHCGGTTTRYLYLDSKVLICRSCLNTFDKILADSLLKDLN